MPAEVPVDVFPGAERVDDLHDILPAIRDRPDILSVFLEVNLGGQIDPDPGVPGASQPVLLFNRLSSSINPMINW